MNPTKANLKSEGADDVQNADLDSARRVLRLEAQALDALSQSLDGGFVRALDLLSGIKGRVIVTGMGKSGHIARKIAATLASTGTPAFFVHPGEASHGDLGMVTVDDAIIALSNSGETPELSDIIAHAKRFAIPLVAITRRADGTLGESADVVLRLPDTPEACSMGLAPTTSTTATLGLGDAIAVALLDRKGFSASDFRSLHPGGQLGLRLLKVSELMHQGDELPLTGPDTPMSQAIIEITSKRFGCIGIVDATSRLLGIVTDGDIRRHMDEGLLRKPVSEVMTVDPKTIRPQALASEAVQVMNATGITNLFVVDEGIAVGVLHLHDCLRAGVA
ncbi:MAG: KpsF/GutQ family sugar-phosphate isomerase [Rhodospirillales bacterium]|nr:KpsF/GutQ family sugar-phosphate isomerase [Rhodospirillales bacterium]MCW8862413.1 KpsF/GutQ family sugar-phosphate isomerase [Rhodospirillales bacterium]MCW8953106.1 KpsF/GutQ family sugar-phosphate isomerase [Rhodospirillales bacterium]MCW8970846.1 KpsF/GutQ family sugar-phosphate isomerase [Rhodospirillales bacterium]MCW9001571.1 KpsF/GutQ family sugar-phosphate isomerase [Rhodospirillales bacterium]